jgi:outer membrane protein assembly factor BamB
MSVGGRVVAIAVFTWAISLFPLAVGAQRLTPALDLSPAAHQAELLRDDLARQSAGLEDAGRRLTALTERGDRAFVAREGKQGEGSADSPGPVLLSLPAFLASLPADRVGSLGDFRAGTLRRELEALRSRGDSEATDIVDLALRNPQSSVRAEMIALAAQRLARRGDGQGATDVLELGDVALPVRPTAPTSTIATLLNSYWWFGKQPDRLGGVRVYPLRVASNVFIATPTHAISIRLPAPGSDAAIKLDWVYPAVAPAPAARKSRLSNAPDAPQSEEWQAARLDLPSFEPAVLSSEDGVPRIVVARHFSAEGTATLLRAYRASDGTVLWSTDPSDRSGDADTAAGFDTKYAFCSSPCVAGRYVYLLATDGVRSGGGVPRAASLRLLALEVTSGRLLFATALGGLSQVPPVGRGKRNSPENITRTPGLWDEQTPLRVAGACVYVHAAGAVFQIERFTGLPLRATTYATCAEVAREGSDPAAQPASRWTTTPLLAGENGEILVLAPRDTEDVIALDRRTLRLLWRVARLGAYTPFAVFNLSTGPAIALQGRDNLLVLGARDGQVVFKADLRSGAKSTGPAMLLPSQGGGPPVIAVPTDRGPMLLVATTGQWLPNDTPITVPNARMWASGDLVPVLRQANVLAAWTGTADAQDADPPTLPLPPQPDPAPPRRPQVVPPAQLPTPLVPPRRVGP